ncbi:hypothetical protein PS6_005254 [Mucor atramentarius]
MEKLLAPFDRESKEVPKTINIPEKSVIEGTKISNRPQIELSGFRKMLTAGIEIWQQQQQQQ